MDEKLIEELMKVKVEELEHLLEKRREAVLKNCCKVKPGDVVISSEGLFLGIADIQVTDCDTRVDKLLEGDSLHVIIDYFYLGYNKLSKNGIYISLKELSCLKRVGTFTYNKDTLVLESLNIVINKDTDEK